MDGYDGPDTNLAPTRERERVGHVAQLAQNLKEKKTHIPKQDRIQSRPEFLRRHTRNLQRLRISTVFRRLIHTQTRHELHLPYLVRHLIHDVEQDRAISRGKRIVALDVEVNEHGIQGGAVI